MSADLLSLCEQLKKEGKAVSVGMLKSRAPKSVRLPDIVHAVQLFKRNPVAKSDSSTTNNGSDITESQLSDSEKILQLESKVEKLEARLAALEAQLPPQNTD